MVAIAVSGTFLRSDNEVIVVDIEARRNEGQPRNLRSEYVPRTARGILTLAGRDFTVSTGRFIKVTSLGGSMTKMLIGPNQASALRASGLWDPNAMTTDKAAVGAATRPTDAERVTEFLVHSSRDRSNDVVVDATSAGSPPIQPDDARVPPFEAVPLTGSRSIHQLSPEQREEVLRAMHGVNLSNMTDTELRESTLSLEAWCTRGNDVRKAEINRRQGELHRRESAARLAASGRQVDPQQTPKISTEVRPGKFGELLTRTMPIHQFCDTNRRNSQVTGAWSYLQSKGLDPAVLPPSLDACPTCTRRAVPF